MQKVYVRSIRLMIDGVEREDDEGRELGEICTAAALWPWH